MRFLFHRWRLLAQCSRYLHLAKLLKLGEKLTLLAGYLRTDLTMEVYIMTLLDPDDRVRVFKHCVSGLFTLVLECSLCHFLRLAPTR